MEITEFEIQLSVHKGMVRMYDRHMTLCIERGIPTISFSDFINQILVRGMYEYAKQLAVMEKV